MSCVTRAAFDEQVDKALRDAILQEVIPEGQGPGEVLVWIVANDEQGR